MTTNDIVDLIKNNNFVIYGNGYIAQRFLRCIEDLGCSSHILNIAVTKVPAVSDNANVVPIAEVDRNSLIFVATHDEIATEMETTARELGFTKVVSIYYHIFDLEMGLPIQRDITVKVDKLISHYTLDYCYAVYYCTILDYLGENKYDGVIYIKHRSRCETLEYAKRRWARFKKTMDEFEKFGFHQDCNVKMCKDYCLVDGLHRLTLAKYYGCDSLKCDMYDKNADFYIDYDVYAGRLLKRSDLGKYFNQNEIADIETAARLIKE